MLTVERHIPCLLKLRASVHQKIPLRGCKGKPRNRRHVPLKINPGPVSGTPGGGRHAPAGEWRVEGEDKAAGWQAGASHQSCALRGDSSLSLAYVWMRFLNKNFISINNVVISFSVMEQLHSV